ncbi:MAG: hypothetical protein AAFQ80_21435 [Cyanobacteria bacterium J06621_8]
MPRPINRKCAACAKLCISKSRNQTCWSESKCISKRNYYRTRSGKTANKRQNYARDTGKVLPTTFEILPDTYRAELIMFGKPPDKLGLVKGGVKGFQVNIYQGSKLVSQSQVVSCSGMVQSDLEAAIDKALDQVKQLFEVVKFGQIIWQ